MATAAARRGRLALSSAAGAAGGGLSGWIVGVSALAGPAAPRGVGLVVVLVLVGTILGAVLGALTPLLWRWIEARPR